RKRVEGLLGAGQGVVGKDTLFRRAPCDIPPQAVAEDQTQSGGEQQLPQRCFLADREKIAKKHGDYRESALTLLPPSTLSLRRAGSARRCWDRSGPPVCPSPCREP